jgi:hypothetical protein
MAKKKDNDKESQLREVLTPYTEWIFGWTTEQAKTVVDKYFRQKPVK